MPEFLEDPTVLTKDKLKSELVANNVSLPPGDQRKDVYVQLYLQHLTSRNRATPDFSSDEEREATPIRGRGRPAGRKATKKTDKPKAEEKDDPDVSELSNEALKEALIKYGFKPGPILGSTRKVHEQKLLKLKQQGSVVSSKPLAADSSTADSGNQNGNTDSEHYSDNEEETKLDLTFEKREPLRSRQKAQVTLRNRRTEQNETAEDKDVLTELNVKRSGRSPPKDFTSDVKEFNSSAKPSEDAVETILKTGTAKTGRLQAVTKDTTRVSRRTPRKMVVAADPITFDDADITESAPVTETIIPASNQNLAYTTTYEHFESRQVVNKVPESFKHAETLLSVNDFSDLSRRTPKKHLISEKHLSLLQHVEADSPHKKVIDVDIIGYTKSSDLLNTALIEVLEKTFSEEKISERDILKDMFPHEVATPTGISASCRKPIKGAAGRPLNPRDFKMNEIYSSKYVPKYTPVVEVKAEKTKSKRSLPMWIKILLFVVLAVFCFLVYQTMETNEGNPFAKYLQGTSVSSKAQN